MILRKSIRKQRTSAIRSATILIFMELGCLIAFSFHSQLLDIKVLILMWKCSCWFAMHSIASVWWCFLILSRNLSSISNCLRVPDYWNKVYRSWKIVHKFEIFHFWSRSHSLGDEESFLDLFCSESRLLLLYDNLQFFSWSKHFEQIRNLLLAPTFDILKFGLEIWNFFSCGIEVGKTWF